MDSLIIELLIEKSIIQNDPDCLNFIKTEIMSNGSIKNLYQSDRNHFINRINDDRFITMIYNKYLSLKNEEEKNKSKNIQQTSTSTSTSTSVSASVPIPIPIQFQNQKSEIIELNMLPDMDDIYFLCYKLSLDLNKDLYLDDSRFVHNYEIPLVFDDFGNISKVEIESFYIKNDMFVKYDYVYVKIREMKGTLFSSKKNSYFGKLRLNNEKIYEYIPEHKSCSQNFNNPISLNKFTLTFYNSNNEEINIHEIISDEIIDDNNTLKISCSYNHNLSMDDIMIINIYQKDTLDITECKIKEIINDKDFIIEKTENFEIDENTKIFRKNINASINFKLYELNDITINKRNKTAINLIELNNIIKSHNHY